MIRFWLLILLVFVSCVKDPDIVQPSRFKGVACHNATEHKLYINLCADEKKAQIKIPPGHGYILEDFACGAWKK